MHHAGVMSSGGRLAETAHIHDAFSKAFWLGVWQSVDTTEDICLKG